MRFISSLSLVSYRRRLLLDGMMTDSGVASLGATAMDLPVTGAKLSTTVMLPDVSSSQLGLDYYSAKMLNLKSTVSGLAKNKPVVHLTSTAGRHLTAATALRRVTAAAAFAVAHQQFFNMFRIKVVLKMNTSRHNEWRNGQQQN